MQDINPLGHRYYLRDLEDSLARARSDQANRAPGSSTTPRVLAALAVFCVACAFGVALVIA